MLYTTQMLIRKRASSSIVTDGLVLWYDAINNTGSGHSNSPTNWFDLSGNGNHGALTAVTWDANAAIFDGSAYVTTPYTLPEAANYTVEVRLLQTSGEVRKLIFTQYVGPSLNLLVAIGSDNILEIRRNHSSIYADYGTVTAPVNTACTTTFMRDGTAGVAVLNADSTGTVTQTVNPPQGVPMIIGGRGDSTSNRFTGKIMSVRVYTRALSAPEIANNYAYDQATYPS